MPFCKGGYKAMMWGIVGILIALLLIIFFRYKSSHSATRRLSKSLTKPRKNLMPTGQKLWKKNNVLEECFRTKRTNMAEIHNLNTASFYNFQP